MTKAFLLVDDEASTRGAMARILERCYPQIEIRRASDGDEALAMLDDDVAMPRRDGFSLCWSIRNAAPYRPWRDVPVVLVSALFHDEDAVERAWRAGTALLVQKPFGRGEIVRAVTGLTRIASTGAGSEASSDGGAPAALQATPAAGEARRSVSW
ncbi:MAG: response regulator [Deltaproteobacteria bacterium]|nr:response regulator [Deltaproteobacteria bacterium]